MNSEKNIKTGRMRESQDPNTKDTKEIKGFKKFFTKKEKSEKMPQETEEQANTHGPGLRLVALAGTEEIGMNMTLYTYQEKSGEKYTILVDCGVTFDGMPGANVVMPDINHLLKEGIVIDAIILTHGHEDHIGALPYLYNLLNAPMYATPFTCGLIENKMRYNKIKDYMLECIKCGESRQIGPFNIKWIAMPHSIPDNAMLAIEVGGVRVLHTGDWKLDPEPIVGSGEDSKSIEEFAKKGIHALISDSTNIHEEETAHSEGEVADSLKELICKTKKGKFVLTCFASNIARVHSCLVAAAAAGRKVLILGTSLKKSVEVAVDLKYIKDDLMISEEEAAELPSEQVLIISTGSQGEMNSALWKMANKSRMAGSILEKGDTLVFSARVIDGHQHEVRVIINQLVERGIRVYHPWNSKDSCIHASGHPGQPDIAQLLDWAKPKFVIPVHSDAEHRISHIAFAQSKGYKTFNLHNGVVIEITPNEIIKHGKIEHGRVAYDGNRLISTTSEIFKQRKEMHDHGVVIISVAMKNKKPTCVVTSYGVYDKVVDFNTKKNLSLSKQLKYDIERMLNSYTSSEFVQKENAIRSKVFDTARNTIWSQIKKNPMIGCHIIS